MVSKKKKGVQKKWCPKKKKVLKKKCPLPQKKCPPKKKKVSQKKKESPKKKKCLPKKSVQKKKVGCSLKLMCSSQNFLPNSTAAPSTTATCSQRAATYDVHYQLSYKKSHEYHCATSAYISGKIVPHSKESCATWKRSQPLQRKCTEKEDTRLRPIRLRPIGRSRNWPKSKLAEIVKIFTNHLDSRHESCPEET